MQIPKAEVFMEAYDNRKRIALSALLPHATPQLHHHLNQS